MLNNVKSMTFAEEQGSFLVGAAAALKTKTGKIGFIGGVENDLIKKFEAGYVAGAKAAKPDIEVAVQYITQPPDFTGFNDPAKGKEIATSMYSDGNDVVYAAAGGSGLGVFEAASETGKQGEVWAIGVDSDQYNLVDAALQPYILTSMLKKVDVAVVPVDRGPRQRQVGRRRDGVRPRSRRRRLLDVRRLRRRHQDAARRLQAADHRRQDRGAHQALITRHGDIDRVPARSAGRALVVPRSGATARSAME